MQVLMTRTVDRDGAALGSKQLCYMQWQKKYATMGATGIG